MSFFKRLSIKNKIIFLITSISASVLITGLIILSITEIKLIKREKAETAHSIINIISEYSVTALAFNYPDRGRDNLEKLGNNPAVISCSIYTKKGNLFATYTKDINISVKDTIDRYDNNEYFMLNEFFIQEKIVFEGKEYGWVVLVLESNIATIYIFIIGLSAIMLLVLLVLAYALANRFQKIISDPIIKLTDAARKISESGVYSIRVKNETYDEIGDLYTEFNEMLNIIETRIRERNIAEQQLREREIWYKTILNSLNDMVFIHDINGALILDTNNRASDLLGYSYDQLLNMKVGDISPNDEIYNQDNAEKNIRECYNKGSGMAQWMFVDKKGRKFWTEINMRKAVLGGQDRIIAVVRDIDLRMKQQEELSELRNYLKNIIDSMPSIIVGVNKNGKVTQWNNEAEKLTNIPADLAIGKLFTLVLPEISDLEEYVTNSIKNQSVIRKEKIPFIYKDQQEIYDVTIFPLVSDNITGAVIRIDNVTQKVHLEEMMVQSEKMLSVGGLAAGMAHEINNPLAGIIQNIQVLENRLFKPLEVNLKTAQELEIDFDKIKKYIEKRGIFYALQSMNDAGKRAAKIVRDMLDFSRKSSSREKNIDIKELLDKTVEIASNDYDLKKHYDFREIEIVREYDPQIPLIYCEPNKIQQVFLNILKNGAQAMVGANRKESSKFILRIYFNEKFLVTEIIDNGPGMSKTVQNRVFEPFFTTKEVGTGTGLGLSVSYFIIRENHNGQMLVESEEGKGTKFIIKLPLELSGL